MSSVGIAEALGRFNPKDRPLRQALLAQHGPAVAHADAVIAVLQDAAQPLHARLGASWLLKQWADRGWRYTPRQSTQLVDMLGAPLAWQSRVHILQMLSALQLPLLSIQTLYPRLKDGLADENKFVRAWAYNGLAVCAATCPEYRDEARRILTMGLRDEPPAVKARVRHALAGLEKISAGSDRGERKTGR